MTIAERAAGLRSAFSLRRLRLRVSGGRIAAGRVALAGLGAFAVLAARSASGTLAGFAGFAGLATLAGLGVLAAIDAPAADRYEGIAYVRGTDRIAYRETDWLFERAGVAERVALYRCPGGAPFGRKHVRDVPSAAAPDFDFEDARDGYREGVRSDHGARQIFVQENAHAPLDVRPLPERPGAVLDAGFDAYVRAHWRELTAGDSLRFPFLIPSHFDYLELKISSSHDAVVDGQPVRQLRMGLAAWYGFAIPSIALTYDRDGQRLQEFQGIGTVRDASGHNQNVRIVFPAPDFHAGVPEDEVDRAAAEPLVTQCGG